MGTLLIDQKIKLTTAVNAAKYLITAVAVKKLLFKVITTNLYNCITYYGVGYLN